MTKFLKGYGLNWVGTEASEQDKKNFKADEISKDLKNA